MTDHRLTTRRPRSLLAVLLLALAALVLAAAPAGAIYAGQPADPGEWGFIVALQKRGQSDFQDQFCAGSLIAPRLVLTAAHCVVDEHGETVAAARLQVRPGGEPLRRTRTPRVDVARIIVHPLYDDLDQGWDAAVLVLAADARGPVVALPGAGEAAPDPPAELLAAGWGDLTDGGKRFPTDLREGTLRLLSPAACRRVLGDLFNGGSDLCAGNWGGGQDTCRGDSGGPLVHRAPGGRAVLVGLTSRGRGCGRVHTPGVYTRVAAIAGWLAPLRARFAAPAAPRPEGPPVAEPAAPPVAEPAAPPVAEPAAPPVAEPTAPPVAEPTEPEQLWLRLIGRI